MDNVNIMFLEQLVKGSVTLLMYTRDAKELYGLRGSTKFEQHTNQFFRRRNRGGSVSSLLDIVNEFRRIAFGL